MARRSETTSTQGETHEEHVKNVEVQETRQPPRRGRSKDMVANLEGRLTRVEESTAEIVENVGSLEERMQARLEGLEEEDATLSGALKLLQFNHQEELKKLTDNFMGELNDMRAHYEEQLKIICGQLKDALTELAICKRAIANGATSAATPQVQEKGPRQEVPRPHKNKSHNGENGEGELPSLKKKKKKHVGKNSYVNNKHDGQHNKQPKWQANNASGSKPPRNCFVCDEPHWFKNCPKKQIANTVMAEFWAFQRKKEKEKECEEHQRAKEKESECQERQVGTLQLLSSLQCTLHHNKKKKRRPRKEHAQHKESQLPCTPATSHGQNAQRKQNPVTQPSNKARRGRRDLGGGECHGPCNSQEVSTNVVAQQDKKPTHKEGQVCGTFRKNQEYSTRLAKICQQAKNILESSRMPYKALEKSAMY